jgi:4-carboxymuconolactone decarboxylase
MTIARGRFDMPRLIIIGFVCFGAGVLAAQNARTLNLRGDRFKPLTWEQLPPAQKTMVEDVLAGARGSLNGPYNVLLRSPEMGNLAQKFGEYVRFRSSVPRKLNEMAILMTARFWLSQFEWTAHRPAAAMAGLSADVIDAIQAGRRPARMQPDETVVYDFCSELLERRRVSDTTFKAAVDLLDERGVVDLIGVMGYYDLVAMSLNVDRYPLPEGTMPPFAEPR